MAQQVLAWTVTLNHLALGKFTFRPHLTLMDCPFFEESMNRVALYEEGIPLWVVEINGWKNHDHKMQLTDSRKTLARIRDELLRKYCQPPPPPPAPPSPEEEWKKAVVEAYAKIFVLVTCDPDEAHPYLGRFLPPGLRFPTEDEFQLRIRGVTGIYERIEQGGLEIIRELGLWRPEFLHGLKLAGALHKDSGRGWAIWSKRHKDLLRDFEELPFPHKLENTSGRNGLRRLRRCPLSYLPAADPEGASVLAGLFASARICSRERERWLELPGKPEITSILDHWTVAYWPSRVYRGNAIVQIPPFYAALFAHLMPVHSATRILSLRRTAMSPMLAQIYWDRQFSRKGKRILPFADALPFGCSKRTYYRLQWKRRKLHWKAVLELKILSLDVRLLDLMRRWFDEHEQARIRKRAMKTQTILAVPVEGGDSTANL
jgi:hypothetical protein